MGSPTGVAGLRGASAGVAGSAQLVLLLAAAYLASGMTRPRCPMVRDWCDGIAIAFALILSWNLRSDVYVGLSPGVEILGISSVFVTKSPVMFSMLLRLSILCFVFYLICGARL